MFFEKNLASLKKRYPELAERVVNTPITGRYKLLKSQSGRATLIDTKTNRNFYNSLDPLMLAEQDINSRNINLGSAAIFLGFGLGYQMIKYLTKYNSATILVIEEDLELLKVAMSANALTDLFNYPNFNLIAGVSLQKMYPQMYEFLRVGKMLVMLKSINIIENATALQNSKEYYLGVIRVLRDGIRGVLELYGNDPHDSLIGIKYILQNLSTIIESPGIEDLKDAFKGKPGVVVATGPSLNKNVHLLEGICDKAVIVGADASAKVLKSKGLKPAHMVTSLERVMATSKLFEGLTEEDVKDSYLAACPVVVPETYANFPGEKVIVYRDFATFTWLDIPKGQLEIGPSAGNMAFKVLEYLGCDPIILIGQDLAYAEDMRSHAAGTHYGETSDTARYAGSYVQLPGNYSETVMSTPVWRSFMKFYEKDVSTFNGTVINATEGGAKIIGTELMTFQEAIDKYINDDVNAADVIKNKLKDVPKAKKKKQFKETEKKLKHAIEYSKELIERLDKGIAHCVEYEQIMGKAGGNPTAEDEALLLKEVEGAESVLSNVSDKNFFLILMHYVQSYFINAMLKVNEVKFKMPHSRDRTSILIVQYKGLMTVLKQLVEKILEEFHSSYDKLEKYIEEHDVK